MSRTERLQKYLSRVGVSSRREAEQYIVNGRVRVNDEVVNVLGTKVDSAQDKISVDGAVLSAPARRLYLFYKPRGVITSLSDPFGRKCVGEHLAALSDRVYPVGRLDRNVTGLLLLTNDGDFAQQMLHPSFEIKRVYWAIVRGRPDKAVFKRLTAGVRLRDGVGRASAAKCIAESSSTRRLLGELPKDASVVEITVTEGRKHFVKSILKVVGHPVVGLCRVAFGKYQLSDLEPGEIREISF